MTTYAKNTTVPVERSKAELERTLARYGADSFASGWDTEAWVIAFRYDGRHYRIRLARPKPGSRTTEQEERQKWRALCLIVKGKLEAVSLGIESFEEAWLANLMLPDGSTVGEWAGPQIDAIYATGRMPDSLPGLNAPTTATYRELAPTITEVIS